MHASLGTRSLGRAAWEFTTSDVSRCTRPLENAAVLLCKQTHTVPPDLCCCKKKALVTASRVAFRGTQNAVEGARGRPVGNVHLPKPERIARNGGD